MFTPPTEGTEESLKKTSRGLNEPLCVKLVLLSFSGEKYAKPDSYSFTNTPGSTPADSLERCR